MNYTLCKKLSNHWTIPRFLDYWVIRIYAGGLTPLSASTF